jgi:hypothetical protein
MATASFAMSLHRAEPRTGGHLDDITPAPGDHHNEQQMQMIER